MANQKPLMTSEQQMKYKQAVNQGVMDSLPYEDYCSVTPEQAEKQIKKWEKEKSVDFSKPVPQRASQSQTPAQTQEGADRPMSSKQASAVAELVKSGHLNPVSREKWQNMTSKEAGKLIYIGRGRREKGEMAPPPERDNAQDKSPTKKNNRPSRGNDMPM